MPGWARFLEISRPPRSATNVNDYRGSVGVVGYSCLPPRRRPRVAVSAMPQCDDLDTPGHPCVRITKDLDIGRRRACLVKQEDFRRASLTISMTCRSFGVNLSGFLSGPEQA